MSWPWCPSDKRCSQRCWPSHPFLLKHDPPSCICLWAHWAGWNWTVHLNHHVSLADHAGILLVNVAHHPFYVKRSVELWREVQLSLWRRLYNVLWGSGGRLLKAKDYVIRVLGLSLQIFNRNPVINLGCGDKRCGHSEGREGIRYYWAALWEMQDPIFQSLTHTRK